MAVAPRDLTGEHRTDRAVPVTNRRRNFYVLLLFKRGLRLGNQFVIERVCQAMILRFTMVAGDIGGHLRHMENTRKVEALGLPVRDTGLGFK